MFQITCPYCGPRNEDEFVFTTEGGIVRPSDPAGTTDSEWSDYLFNRNNINGMHYELWQHRFGCRQLVRVARDTMTHDILGTWCIHESVPAISKLKLT